MSPRPTDPRGIGGSKFEDRPYLTIHEAAVRLRCSTKTVRRYIASGKLQAYRVGPTMLRIRLTDLDALVAAGAVPNARTA